MDNLSISPKEDSNNNTTTSNNNMEEGKSLLSKKDDSSNISTSTIEEQRKKKKQLKKEQKEKRILEHQKRVAIENPHTTFHGKHKWLGGAIDPETGKIYGIPSHSYKIICITPSGTKTDTKTGISTEEAAQISTIPLPNEYQKGHFKWLRGLVHNGYLYGIPAWNAKGVLKVRLNPSLKGKGKRIQVLPLPHDPCYYISKNKNMNDDDKINDNDNVTTAESKSDNINDQKSIDRGRWMWHGGAVGNINDETKAAIYCVPSNAQHVLKVSLDGSDKVTEIGPPLAKGQNKWYGGIKGLDGCIYGMPYTATGVLRIDPSNDHVEVLGDYPEGGWKWHGGLLAHSTGVIYAFPAHSNEVLCVDTNIKCCNERGVKGDDNGAAAVVDQSWRVTTIPIQRHEDDTDSHDLKYKWLGGAYGADGCIYGMPSDATSILRIDPLKNEATTFGKVSTKINKFQGGVLSKVDNCVYAVPADMGCVLRIDTDPNTPLSIDLVGEGFQDVDDKWQGGFLANDDKIYAIPENINNVMVITPGSNPIVEKLK